MTMGGAFSELNNLLKSDDIPFYYKPSIKAVMATITLSSSENPNKWIPVSERLPEYGEYVLLYYERDAWIDNDCIRKKDIDKGWQIEGRWHVYGASGVVGIAWMPLPKPYKGEGEDEK